MAGSELFLKGPFKMDLRKAFAPPEERRERGRAARERVPRGELGGWAPSPGRPDPVDTVTATAAQRQQKLIPIRNARMAASAFAFYRGTAELMASDLASRPHTGLYVQLCGDAHLSNFGLYASPERTLVYDINDLDETSQGPWEWDLKRLATSFVLLARENGVPQLIEEALRTMVAGYVYAMMLAADEGWLERRRQLVRAEPEDGRRRFDPQTNAAIDRIVAKAKEHTQDWTVRRYTEVRDGELRLRLEPPLITPVPQRVHRSVAAALNRYLASLSFERRAFLLGYHLIDVAHKVVGVGSVGTYDYVALLEGDGPADHLLLQVKEAGPSAIKTALGEAHFLQHGERVVAGIRLLQAVSDPFLGWTSIGDRAFYVRQLKDMKGSIPTEVLVGPLLYAQAMVCGYTLGLAHARVGDPHLLLGYIGKGRAVADAISSFATAYADQAEQDYAAFKAAVDDGRLPVADPVEAGLKPVAAGSAKATKAAAGGAKQAKAAARDGKQAKAKSGRKGKTAAAETADPRTSPPSGPEWKTMQKAMRQTFGRR